MEMALSAGNPQAAQLVAAECVVEAETKDHLNWELLALVAEKMEGRNPRSFKRPLMKWKRKRTNIFTTPPDRLGNYG
jgi:hypothetical protein